LFPLTTYREKVHSSWGNVGLLLAPYAKHTFPRVLAVLPLVLVPTAGRAVLAARRGERPAVTRLALLSLAGAGAVASILYYPDFVHLAFIAPLLLVAATEHLEAAMQQVRIPARVAWIGGGLVPALGLIAVAPWLRSTLLATRAIYPVSEDTAFGRVDMASDVVVSIYRTVERLVRQVPDRALFSYPAGSDLYLLTGARNPTRYEFFMSGYNTREQVDEVIRALEVRRVPYVVVNPLLTRPGDPIGAFIREHYAPLDDGTIAGKVVFRLK
jgi:hypothetical protein